MRKNEAKFTTVFFSEAGTKNKNNDYFGYFQYFHITMHYNYLLQ